MILDYQQSLVNIWSFWIILSRWVTGEFAIQVNPKICNFIKCSGGFLQSEIVSFLTEKYLFLRQYRQIFTKVQQGCFHNYECWALLFRLSSNLYIENHKRGERIPFCWRIPLFADICSSSSNSSALTLLL